MPGANGARLRGEISRFGNIFRGRHLGGSRVEGGWRHVQGIDGVTSGVGFLGDGERGVEEEPYCRETR